MDSKFPSAPTFKVNPSTEDEFDLVDIGIVFWSQRNLLISTTLGACVVGILCWLLFYSPQPVAQVRSIVDVGSSISDGNRVPAVAPDTFAGHIRYTLLPQFLTARFNSIAGYINGTEIRSTRKSNMLEIVNQVSVTSVAEVVEFHEVLMQRILQDLENVNLAQINGDNLLTVERRALRLQDLVLALEREMSAQSEIKVNSPSREDLQLRKLSLRSEIEFLSELVTNLKYNLIQMKPKAITTAAVSEHFVGLKATTALPLIAIFSLLLAIFVIAGVNFIGKVRERLAMGG